MNVQESHVSEQLLASKECRLTERMHQLKRLLAAEHAASFPQGELLFLRLEPAEVGRREPKMPNRMCNYQAGAQEFTRRCCEVVSPEYRNY